jgi:hypothetical protein
LFTSTQTAQPVPLSRVQALRSGYELLAWALRESGKISETTDEHDRDSCEKHRSCLKATKTVHTPHTREDRNDADDHPDGPGNPTDPK